MSRAVLRLGVVVYPIPVRGAVLRARSQTTGAAGPWVAGNLHVVVGDGRNHNSPVHSSAQGPPRGLCLAIRREIHQAMQLLILQAIQPGKQRRVRLLKRLLKRRAIQRRIQPGIQVEIKVEIQVEVQVEVQVEMQLIIRPSKRREIRGEVRRTSRVGTCALVPDSTASASRSFDYARRASTLSLRSRPSLRAAKPARQSRGLPGTSCHFAVDGAPGSVSDASLPVPRGSL